MLYKRNFKRNKKIQCATRYQGLYTLNSLEDCFTIVTSPMSPAPRKPWTEPPDKGTLPSFSKKEIPTWSEPPPAERYQFERGFFSIMKHMSRSKSHQWQESDAIPQRDFGGQPMPRFKRIRHNRAKSARSEEVDKLLKINELWLHVVLHLAKFRWLYIYI